MTASRTIGRWLRHGSLCAVAVGFGLSQQAAGETASSLEDGFRQPPAAARPHVWWHWMSGNVTAEGARLDLEWMQRVGVGGVHAFSGGQLEPTFVAKPAPFMSETWRSAYRASVIRARKLGMDFVIAGSPGWSETGGPWVKPAQAMKKYVYAATEVEGGRPITQPIARPPGVTGPFGAIGLDGFLTGKAAPGPQASGDGPVVAFRSPSPSPRAPARYTSPAGPVAALAEAPDDLSRVVTLPLAKGATTDIDIDQGTSVAIGAVTIASDPLPAFDILASDDGVAFRLVRSVGGRGALQIDHPSPQTTIAFSPVTARYFRIRFAEPSLPSSAQGMMAQLPAMYAPILLHVPSSLKLRRLSLRPGAWVDRYEAKAGFQAVADFGATATPAAQDAIRPAEVVDLTTRLRRDGTLDWTPPPGRWTILRFGWSLTGQKNGPAEPAGTGLEVDKLDPVAVRAYADALFALYHDDVGAPLGRGGIDGLLTDSWEAGVQNWSPAILSQFRRLRGYDPTPWLPVLAGHVVGDARASDGFLFDFRRTLKDLVVENHYAVLAQAAHRRGMTYYTEVQGDTPRAISDGMIAKSRSDIPTAEFWYRPFATAPGQPSLVADLQEAASVAHVYGKPLAAAEAMTVAAGGDPWAFSPAMLKPVADEIFARGINRILIHDSHLQPDADRKPGLMLGFFGQFFNRNDTWAEQARPWTDYLARTSYLLQQGRYVADVAYFYGEEKSLGQIFGDQANVDVPNGYGFDYVDPEALLTRLAVRDGKIVTASGMSYRLLFVPPAVTSMTLPALRKLDAMVRAGAVVVARRPTGGLGLRSPDAEVARLASRLWGDGEPVRKIGRGRLYTQASLAEALAAEGIAADVEPGTGGQLLSLHRRVGETDLYFVSNRAGTRLAAPVTFRAAGRLPEWWSAEDGSTRPLSYSRRGDRTSVALPLEAGGAGFVVFRRPANAASRTVTPPAAIAVRSIDGPWDVSFEPGRGGPATARFDTLHDWAGDADPRIRYFSGRATYSKTVVIDPSDLGPRRSIEMDLGDVRELAVVTVDGRPAGTAWHPPYVLDLTGKLRAGPNRIEVEVVNLWPNRLIGDKQPGATPVAYAPQSPYKADSPLRPSGLLGPVRLNVSAVAE